MDITFRTALADSALAALATSLGIRTIRRHADWGERNSGLFMAFAAGVLLTASVLHLIPKSIAMNPHAPAAPGLGVVVALAITMSEH